MKRIDFSRAVLMFGLTYLCGILSVHWAVAAQPSRKAEISVNNTHIYWNPSSKSKAWATADSGTPLLVHGEKNGFYKVGIPDDLNPDPRIFKWISKSNVRIIREKIQRHHTRPWSLAEAARIGDLDAIRWYLHHGVNVDQTDRGGYTPLVEACVRDQYQAAKLLIRSGADVNAKSDGLTVLMWCKKGSKSYRMLRAAGATLPGPSPVDFHSLESPLYLSSEDMGFYAVERVWKVHGFVQNRTDTPYSYVEVDVVFYDDNGIQVGDGIANTRYLGPGDDWRFEIVTNNSSVMRYKIVKVRGIKQ